MRRRMLVVLLCICPAFAGAQSGFGAEDGVGDPMLPPDRTFADVLAGVDEIVFTTLEPGFVFGFTDYDLRIDNIGINFGLIFADGFETGDTSAWQTLP